MQKAVTAQKSSGKMNSLLFSVTAFCMIEYLVCTDIQLFYIPADLFVLVLTVLPAGVFRASALTVLPTGFPRHLLLPFYQQGLSCHLFGLFHAHNLN